MLNANTTSGIYDIAWQAAHENCSAHVQEDVIVQERIKKEIVFTENIRVSLNN